MEDVGGELDRNSANYVPLSPLTFLERSARVFPRKTAVIHGDRRITYAQFHERARRLASALTQAGVHRGETVAIMAPNVPALLEAHFGVPMAGAVLNAINVRLDAATVRFILGHGGARVFIVDRDYAEVVREALSGVGEKPRVIDIVDPFAAGRSSSYTRPSGRRITKRFSRAAIPSTPGRFPKTNGSRSRSTTRRARPAIRRASSITTAALT